MITNKLDMGGFGEVFKAVSEETGDTVVIKKQKIEPGEFEKMKREAEIHSRLKHPNIIGFIDSFEENGYFYIVLEYANKGNLLDYLAKHNYELKLTDKLKIFLKICKGLELLHSKGILHRDLKCENVLLSVDNNGELLVKLADFGASRDVTNVTGKLTLIGTPSYVSPELLMGKSYGKGNDIWGLGCLLYVCLLYKLPFTEPNMNMRILKGQYAPIPVSANIPQGIQEMIAHIFSVNPDDRPTLDQIIKQVNSFLVEPTKSYVKTPEPPKKVVGNVIYEQMIKNYEFLVLGLVVLIFGLLMKSTKFGKLMIVAGTLGAGYIGYQQKTLYD